MARVCRDGQQLYKRFEGNFTLKYLVSVSLMGLTWDIATAGTVYRFP